MKHDYQAIVIGAGAGGLVVAIGLGRAGKRVLLIDKGTWGGDCTNFGCVPSKSLIAASHIAHHIKDPSPWGIKAESPKFNADGALERTRQIVKQIRSHEEPVGLKENGVETLEGVATFVDPHTLQVALTGGGERRVSGAFIVIATGSYPAYPHRVKGIENVPFVTNETIFDLERIPKRMVVMGGGPIGCELGQAFSRLGSQVTITQHNVGLLMKEEPEVRELLQEAFEKEGIECLIEWEVQEAAKEGGEIVLKAVHKRTGESRALRCDVLVSAAGRRPNLEKLKLENVGIETPKKGLETDAYGRTKHKHIYAIGDATHSYPFTHMAENQGRAVLTSLLIPGPFGKKLDRAQAVPKVTYTSPEVASAGMTSAEAIEQYGKGRVAIYKVPMAKVDRAICAGETAGIIIVVTKKWSGKILGCTIMASRAGEMLQELTCAMQNGISIKKLAKLIHPYPTFSLGIRAAADKWLTETVIPLFHKSKS
ncbi:MAG: NAD(P)/FAD-dependent oxidoreductase [Parachlamydiales bacterium]